jgi:methionyl-tRNA formyltransferase
LNPKSLIPQDYNQKSYFPKFTKETAKINWSWDNIKIERFIRALIPWPIAWTFVTDQKDNQLKMKILLSTFDFKLSTLNLDQVQIEGKNKTTWSEISKYYTINKD